MINGEDKVKEYFKKRGETSGTGAGGSNGSIPGEDKFLEYFEKKGRVYEPGPVRSVDEQWQRERTERILREHLGRRPQTDSRNDMASPAEYLLKGGSGANGFERHVSEKVSQDVAGAVKGKVFRMGDVGYSETKRRYNELSKPNQGKKTSGNVFQNLLGEGNRDQEQNQNAAFLMRDPEVTGSLGSEELLAMQKEANSYADSLEEAQMAELEERRRQASREGRPKAEIDAIDEEIEQLKATIKQWRSSAERLSWKANIAGRGEKIAEFEETANRAQEFDAVSSEYSKAGSMKDLRLYNAWLSTAASTGESWEEFYARQNPREDSRVQKKTDAILQGMMDDEASMARDEYEAALRQYQQAEENYYTVPDGDFQKVEDDFLAADERLQAAERRLKQANQAAKGTRKYMLSGKARLEANPPQRDVPEVGNKLEFYLKNRESDSDYGNLPEDVSGVMRYGKENMWDRATQKQRNVYAYLLGTDKEKAEEYLKAIQVEWSREAMTEYMKRIRDGWGAESGWEKAIENVASIPANVLGGLFAGVNAITGMVTKDINPYAQASWGQQYAGTVRELTTDDVYTAVGYDKNSGKEPNFLQKAAANGYNALMSAGDSALGVMLLGKGYTATMGMGASAQKAQELYERGASDKEITMGALTAGTLETLFEYASLDLIIKNQGGEGVKAFIINALKSSGVEASEEVFTEIANKAAEAAMFGANSDTADRENAYIAAGVEPEEAKQKAMLDAAVDVFWAGYGGFISGGVFSVTGVPGAIAEQRRQAQQDKQNRENGIAVIRNQAGKYLIQEAKESGVNPELIQLAEEKVRKDVEEMNRRERKAAELAMGKLHQATIQAQEEQAEAAERETFQQAAQERITELMAEEPGQAGEEAAETGAPKVDAGKAAEALTKAAYGEELNAEEKKTVAAVGGESMIQEIANSREFQQALDKKYTAISRAMEDTAAMTKDLTSQRETVERFAAENGMDADVMKRAIKRSQNAMAFNQAWQSAYDMGAGGIALRYAQKARANSYLTAQQIETAYNEGRKAAESYEAEEGYTDISDGGQWNDRAYSGGQVRAVEGWTAQRQGGESGAGGTAAAAAEKVSSTQLGLTEGTENRNLRRLSEGAYNEDTKVAARVARDNGLEFVAVSGGAIETMVNANGRERVVKSRGCVVDGKMFVRVDDSTFTAEQIARHEAAHEQIRKGEIDVEQTRQKLREQYSDAEIDAIIQLYASAYGDSGLTAEEVLEEIVCDAEAQMNAFATEQTERIAGEVGVFLRNVGRSANAKKVAAIKNTTGNGGVKRSIELDALGRKYVQATRQVIEGNDPARWGKQIENYINQEIRKGNDVLLPTDDGHVLLLTERSAYKLSDRHKQDVKTKVRDLLSDYDFEVKSRMAAHIDELVRVGKFREYRSDYRGNHQNDIGEDGFNYYDAYFKDIDGQYYHVPITAGVNENQETVYSIGNIQKRKHSTDVGSSSKGGARKSGAVPSGDIIVYSTGKSQVQNSLKEAFEKAQREKRAKLSREMDTVKALERQNKILQERVEYWKDQTRKTKVPTADKESVRRLGREILSSYSSSTNVDEILPELQWLANDAIGKGGASYGSLTAAAEKIARKVLEGSEVDVNGDLAEDRQALKKYLQSTRINVTESIKAGIPDFADYKKQNRALHFREDGSGTDVDKMWLELQDKFGTGMFPEDVMNPEDQVRYIADKVAAMAEDIQNPYQKDMEFAVQQLTYDILFQTTMVDRKKPTRADQAWEGTDKAVEKATREMRKLLEEGRQRENDRIVKAQKAELRQKIRTISDQFQRMATRPGKGISQHAPERLRKAVVDFCGIFTESELRRMDRWGKSLEYRAEKVAQKMGEKVTKSTMDEYRTVENQMARRDRMTARLTALQNAYAAMEKDGQYQTTYDQTVADMIKKLSEVLEGKDIYQLDSKELRQVQKTMTAIYYTVTNANKAFTMGKDKTITGMATKMAGEIRQVNPSQAGMAVALKRFIQWQMSPDTFFNALCGFSKGNEGKVIQKGFQRGAERMLETQREFYQMFREFTESDDSAVTKELNNLMNYSQKRMVNWGLKDMEGNEVKTTRGMMLQAYMLLNQQDSFESLQYGGFSLPNADRYYKGDVSGSYGDALETQMMSEPMAAGYTEMVQRNKDMRIRMEELQQKLELADSETYKRRYQDEIQNLEKEVQENQERMEAISSQAAQRLHNIRDGIEQQLTPLEKKLIDRAHEWYAHSGKLMQDVFEQMYGFRNNLEENYVPIHRDQSTIKTDIRDMAGAEKAFNLENSGFTIERVKNYQPILLTDFFEEITRQRDKMARYVGFAQVQKDFGKIWKTRIDGSGMTVNTLVRARFGAGKTQLGVSGEEYVNHYIADVAGGHSSDDILGKFYGNYAAATLQANLRVAASQAASIPTAASVVGWKHMAVGFAKGLLKAFSTKYRNELASKNVWFYKRYQGEGGSTELADIRKKGGIFERFANSKTGKKIFNWCQTVDVFSTGSIMWSAAESYVQEQGIQKGTAEYDAAVNEIYTDIIRKSQPNYTTTERSDLLRDQRAHMKLLTMFKTQSNQNFNLLLEANGEFIRMKQDLKNGRNGVTEADVKAAGKKLANAITGVLLGGTVSFVAIRTILNFILGAVNPYRDDETDEVTLEAAMKGIGEEILSSLAGTVALGGQVYDILMPIMTGDKYYGLSDSAVSSLSSMLENTIAVLQKKTDASRNQVWKMVNSWCMARGVPSGNAKKITDMFDMYIRDIQNGTFGQYTSPNTTDKQYRARIMKHYLAGEMDKADDALDMLLTRSSEDDDEAARKKIAEGMRDYLKDKYIESEITDTEAEKIMAYTGTEEPEKYTARWDFQLAHPEIDSQNIDGLVKAYNQKGNISDKVFLDAWEFAKDAAADKDKDGKTINGSRKQKIVDYVQAIPGLTKDQRRKLFELLNAGSVKGTPFE